MKAVIIIPARYKSTRLPGKCLLKLGDKTIIQHVYEKAKSAEIGEVIVACDDMKIKEDIEKIGGKAVLTSKDCKSGTDRVAEIAEGLKDYEIVINVQGDEPFISPHVIKKAYSVIENYKMATLASKRLVFKDENDPNLVKVVVNERNEAIYFSRSLIPYARDSEKVEILAHIGIYVYKRDFLLSFSKWPSGELEAIEKLEQLRAVEKGIKIKVGIVDYEPLGIDTMNDYHKALKLLENGV